MPASSLVGGTVITLDDERRILPVGTVVIEDGRIADVRSGEVRHGEVVDCRGKLVLPGLVNTHAHVLEVLFRGSGGELKTIPWIRQRKHPLMAQLDDEGARVGARLATLEMLRSGTTAFLDPEVDQRLLPAIAQATVESGLRGGLAVTLAARAGYGHRHDDPGDGHGGHDGHGHGASAGDVLDPSDVDRWMRWHGAGTGRLALWLGLRVLSAATPQFGRSIAREAGARGLRITFHCAESPEDGQAVLDAHGVPQLEFASSMGILGPRTVIGHGVHIAADEIPTLAATGASVAHCPTSNAKLGAGIAPVPGYVAAGVNVALGTDGGMCNDRYDLIAEMRMAGLIHRAAHAEPRVMTPESVLEMATRNGAAALGIDGGALVPGRVADIVAVDPRRLGSWPTQDAVDSLVFAVDGSAVSDVMVGGEMLLREGEPVGVDRAALLRDAEEVAREAVRSAGLTDEIGPDWPVGSPAGRILAEA